jgi:hypothetical protein
MGAIQITRRLCRFFHADGKKLWRAREEEMDATGYAD